MTHNLINYSATKLAQLIKTRVVSPVEVMEAYLQRIEKVNPALNAIVTLASDAMERAHVAKTEVRGEKNLRPLHGVPITIKDTIETAGLRTTFGSTLRRSFVPDSDAKVVGHDAEVVARLKRAGAIILGKTNTPELAIPYETDNEVFGRTNNPHDLSRTPGGSSGGEAAAIAARLSPAGLGSDLSGSIRVPAHFCGIAGLKPTSGLVPMSGHVPSVMGGCIGPMARRVEDLMLLFNVISDSGRWVGTGHVDYAEAAKQVRGLNICWYADDGVVPVTAQTREAVKTVARVLSSLVASTSECLPPGVLEGSRLWIEMFARPARDAIQDFWLGHENEMSASSKALLKPRAPRAEEDLALVKAQGERNSRRFELVHWMRMKGMNIIIAPVGSTPAFLHGTRRLDVEGQNISVFRAFSYSQTYNVFDLPVVTVPVARSKEGLPIGVQIIGRPREEDLVLTVASLVEKELGDWSKR